MSDEFWQRIRARQTGGFLTDEQTFDERIYQAWYTVPHNASATTHLELVPAIDVDPKARRISYIQTINQEFNRHTGELCLMFPSSGMMVFLEGRGLYELGQLISDRRVSFICAFDPSIHQPIGNDAVVVSAIRVEQS